jgi:hypothetical protein
VILCLRKRAGRGRSSQCELTLPYAECEVLKQTGSLLAGCGIVQQSSMAHWELYNLRKVSYSPVDDGVERCSLHGLTNTGARRLPITEVRFNHSSLLGLWP